MPYFVAPPLHTASIDTTRFELKPPQRRPCGSGGHCRYALALTTKHLIIYPSRASFKVHLDSRRNQASCLLWPPTPLDREPDYQVNRCLVQLQQADEIVDLLWSFWWRWALLP